ncbi:hypothetical protein MMIC_P2431 [Mariprofundus micogutta]|uniref:Tetracyclin repressor-like C-terminal domain-containing protein n=1 Tax=Mariprofundus micogutta TaxID=1921010 RepID=A0A1L8CR93_9PROT|nr:hypothetical protein [Mariprofundus micogutta]GAV21442.1 hypothetical protein MMIC_P2431 [Mariprofundus micogutta]
MRAYFVIRLRHLHAFVSETPHMYELIQLVSGKHKDLLQHFEERAKSAIQTILVGGIASGEFCACDTKQRAADLYHASNKYNMPMCMNVQLESLEAELNSLLELLFDGLKAGQ